MSQLPAINRSKAVDYNCLLKQYQNQQAQQDIRLSGESSARLMAPTLTTADRIRSQVSIERSGASFLPFGDSYCCRNYHSNNGLVSSMTRPEKEERTANGLNMNTKICRPYDFSFSEPYFLLYSFLPLESDTGEGTYAVEMRTDCVPRVYQQSAYCPPGSTRKLLVPWKEQPRTSNTRTSTVRLQGSCLGTVQADLGPCGRDAVPAALNQRCTA